jgi:hypothetical protein
MGRRIQMGHAIYMSESTIEVGIYRTKDGPLGNDYNSCATIKISKLTQKSKKLRL